MQPRRYWQRAWGAKLTRACWARGAGQVDALREHGLKIDYREGDGCPPIEIHCQGLPGGPWREGEGGRVGGWVGGGIMSTTS